MRTPTKPLFFYFKYVQKVIDCIKSTIPHPEYYKFMPVPVWYGHIGDTNHLDIKPNDKVYIEISFKGIKGDLNEFIERQNRIGKSIDLSEWLIT